jgi:hypothetical protein
MGSPSENHHPHLPYGKSQSKFFFFFKKKNRTFGIKGKRKKKCCTYGNDRDFDVILVAVDTRGGEERGGHVGQVVSNVGLRRG